MLAVMGLLLVCLSLAALVYALMPVERTQEQYRPAPTLFAPPQSKNLDESVTQDRAAYWQEAWT